MAFDLYFAGSQWLGLDDWIIKNKCCRLQSQLLDRSRIKYLLDNNFEGKLFIDSGAYTAYTRQAVVDVDEYIEYTNNIDDRLTIFAQVDKIPGQHGKPKTREEIEEAPRLSWENYLYMRDRVKSPDKLLPIFHRRENWSYLEQMLETTFDGKHIPYIGIAATTDSTTKEKQEWFRKVFNIIHKSSNPNVKTHAFGMTSLKLLETFPFTSADSTSWIMTGANGSIMSPFGVVYVSEEKKSLPNHVSNMPKSTVTSFNQYLEEMDINFDDIHTGYKGRMLANLKYLKYWADHYEFKGSKTVVSRSLFN